MPRPSSFADAQLWVQKPWPACRTRDTVLPLCWFWHVGPGHLCGQMCPVCKVWPATLPPSECGTADPGEEKRRRGLAGCGGSALLEAWRVHVLPITDKREAVLYSMWFHLEQVKQCRKIDPSPVAFQRPVRNSTKSCRANPARNCRGTKAVGAGAVVAASRRIRAHRWYFEDLHWQKPPPSCSRFGVVLGFFYCFRSNPLVLLAGECIRVRQGCCKQVLQKTTCDLSENIFEYHKFGAGFHIQHVKGKILLYFRHQ